MTRDYTAGLPLLQYHVAAALPHLCKSEAFQSANGLISGNPAA